LSCSSRSRRCTISGVRGIGSLLLLPLELEAVEDSPLRIPELRLRLPCSLEFAPCCLRGANLFWCSTEMFPMLVPPPGLMGRVGGSRVPKLRRVTPSCSVPSCADALVAVAPAVVVPPASVLSAVPRAVAFAPLPLGGRSVLGGCPVSASASSIVSSSCWSLSGMLTSSYWSICRRCV
jgi:hypothetical protein